MRAALLRSTRVEFACALTQDETATIMRTLDAVRQQIGVVYPGEKA